eukprot:jgi/Bigna1/77341/fgenesh1_pg.47_\
MELPLVSPCGTGRRGDYRGRRRHFASSPKSTNPPPSPADAPKAKPTKVLIVGAGVSGLTLNLHLRELFNSRTTANGGGLDVHLVDKAPILPSSPQSSPPCGGEGERWMLFEGEALHRASKARASLGNRSYKASFDGSYGARRASSSSSSRVAEAFLDTIDELGLSGEIMVSNPSCEWQLLHPPTNGQLDVEDGFSLASPANNSHPQIDASKPPPAPLPSLLKIPNSKMSLATSKLFWKLLGPVLLLHEPTIRRNLSDDMSIGAYLGRRFGLGLPMKLADAWMGVAYGSTIWDSAGSYEPFRTLRNKINKLGLWNLGEPRSAFEPTNRRENFEERRKLAAVFSQCKNRFYSLVAFRGGGLKALIRGLLGKVSPGSLRENTQVTSIECHPDRVDLSYLLRKQPNKDTRRVAHGLQAKIKKDLARYATTLSVSLQYGPEAKLPNSLRNSSGGLLENNATCFWCYTTRRAGCALSSISENKRNIYTNTNMLNGLIEKGRERGIVAPTFTRRRDGRFCYLSIDSNLFPKERQPEQQEQEQQQQQQQYTHAHRSEQESLKSHDGTSSPSPPLLHLTVVFWIATDESSTAATATAAASLSPLRKEHAHRKAMDIVFKLTGICEPPMAFQVAEEHVSPRLFSASAGADAAATSSQGEGGEPIRTGGGGDVRASRHLQLAVNSPIALREIREEMSKMSHARVRMMGGLCCAATAAEKVEHAQRTARDFRFVSRPDADPWLGYGSRIL